MAAELCAFSGLFDVAFILTLELKTILNFDIPNMMLTDSTQLFNVVTKWKQTTEKRLIVHIASTLQSYKAFELEHVDLVRGTDNLADGMCNAKSNNALLRIFWHS